VIALLLGGGIYLSAQKSTPARAASQKPVKSHSPAAPVPVHMLAISPADGAHGVNGAAVIRVDFSAPLSANSPMPTLKPANHGS